MKFFVSVFTHIRYCLAEPIKQIFEDNMIFMLNLDLISINGY